MCQWGRTKVMLKEFWADSKLGILQALIIIIHNKPYRLVVMTALKSSVRAKEISIDPVTQIRPVVASGSFQKLRASHLPCYNMHF